MKSTQKETNERNEDGKQEKDEVQNRDGEDKRRQRVISDVQTRESEGYGWVSRTRVSDRHIVPCIAS